MSRTMTGGCQCRRIRYEVDVDNGEAVLCHCGYCRRATGGVSLAYKNVPRAAVRWSVEPDWYRSSEIAERPFCSTCGTSLGFQFREGSEDIDLTVGSFDEPSYFRPTLNYSIETALPAWQDTSGLPGMRMDENADVVDRWVKARGEVPQ